MSELITDEVVQAAVQYGTRVARTMGSDPELESIANIASWRALNMWNGKVPIKRWIAIRVKTSIWCYWRKLRDRHEEATDGWWEQALVSYDEEPVEYDPDFQLLHEYYIDKWPLDVVARRYNLSGKAAAKQYIADALARFMESQ